MGSCSHFTKSKLKNDKGVWTVKPLINLDWLSGCASYTHFTRRREQKHHVLESCELCFQIHDYTIIYRDAMVNSNGPYSIWGATLTKLYYWHKTVILNPPASFSESCLYCQLNFLLEVCSRTSNKPQIDILSAKSKFAPKLYCCYYKVSWGLTDL